MTGQSANVVAFVLALFVLEMLAVVQTGQLHNLLVLVAR
jgi:hypothetical protein